MAKRVSCMWPLGSAFLLLLVGYLLLPSAPVVRAAPHATVWQVDRLDDPALPEGTACTAADDDCSLRGAISQAVDGDTIELIEGGTILLNDVINITENVTITSASAATHLIDGNNSTPIFTIVPGLFDAPVVLIENVTLQNGMNPAGNGGAVSMGAGDLTLRQVVMQDNVAGGRGGALSVMPDTDHATVILDDVTFLRNHAMTSTLSGGAIYARTLFMVPVVVQIEDSRFEDNVGGSLAAGEGGAIVADALDSAGNFDLAVRTTEFISNSSQLGGAIALRLYTEEPGGSGALDAEIYASHFVRNQGEQGGALYVDATGNQAAASVIISTTTFATNTATSNGGAIYHQSVKGATEAAITSLILIEGSVFYGNQTSGGDGGAIYQRAATSGLPTPSSATLDVRNSTFSGNRAGAGQAGGALYVTSSGPISTASFVTTTHVTFFDNAGAGQSSIALAHEGDTPNMLYLKNTLIGGDAGDACASGDLHIAGANNLIHDATCGGVSPFRLGTPTLVIPTLADNGGPTLTHGLYAGSSALDAVPGGECTVGESADVVAFDQRGEPRPFGAACDVGAFEVQTATPPEFPAVTGLTASNDGPTVLGEATLLAATITGGEAVTYAWDFGDGAAGSGITTTHIYSSTGIYTATVVAMNAVNSMTATTTVYVGDAVVEVFNNFYSPAEITIPVGDMVVWVLREGHHSVTAEDGSFNQPAGMDWSPFVHTFDEAGTFDYFCTVHGQSMSGKVIVGDGGGQVNLLLPSLKNEE